MFKKFSRAIKYIASSISFKRCFLPLFAFCFLFAGCKKEVEITVFQEEELETHVNELPAPDASSTSTEKILTLITTPNPATLHPFAVLDENTANLLSLTAEPAIQIMADGSFQPCVIESWELGEDGKTYTFHIRKNVVFHQNYGMVTADDLMFALDTIKNADPATCEYAKYAGVLSSYEKVDDLTLKVTIAQKSQDIFYLMSFPVLPKEYYEGLGLDTTKTPIGTGPYYVETYSEEEGFILKPHSSWWQVPPSFTAIHAKPVVDTNLKIGSSELEEYQVIPTSLMTANSLAASGKTTINQVVTPTYDCLIPNYNNSFLGRQEVRQAISTAINRSELISVALLGQGQAAEMPVNPNFWAYEGLESSASVYSITEANMILDQAGIPLDEQTGLRYVENADGSKRYLKLQLLYTESSEYAYRRAVCEKIAEQLRLIGIEIEPVEADSSTYRNNLEENNFQLALCSFFTNSNGNNEFLFSTHNYGQASTNVLREKLSAFCASMTNQEIQSAFADYVQTYLSEVPTIGLYYRTHALIVHADITVPAKCAYKSAYAQIGQWK